MLEGRGWVRPRIYKRLKKAFKGIERAPLAPNN